MAKALTATINNQITSKDVKVSLVFKINSTDYSTYLINWNTSYDRNFGAASATFTLNNNDGIFGDGGANRLKVGDVVEFSEYYLGDSTEFKKFYGTINQRSIAKNANERSITINCLDYISSLQFLDIDLEVNGTSVKVENETLTPIALSAPNQNLAQLFNFANDGIATDPVPILSIYDNLHSTTDPQYDGYEVHYDVGQIKLGSPLNFNSYSLKATYYYYIKGKYCEDILESILTESDGYGGYLFGESSAAAVISNHLTETFYNMNGTNTDYLTPNLLSSAITIEHTLASNITAGATEITLDSVEGLPNSGTATINGDTFSWTNVDSGNRLTGIPATGGYSLKAHNSGDYLEYNETLPAGQLWYLSYNNVTTDMDTYNFDLPSSVTVRYFDARYGRIILSQAVATSTVISCITNYSFKTLQASGVEVNSIKFRSRELNNRYEAINKLRKYLAPNYIIRTRGNNKIWASFLTQKTTADYTLNLIQDIDYMEDEDLFSRVIMYGKNSNPTNLMFKDGVDFITTGNTYKSLASQSTLSYETEEGDYFVYKSLISDAGYIDLQTIKPVVYINGFAIDDTVHQMTMMPLVQELTTKTETRTGCHGISKEQYTKSHTYYYYKLYFPHVSIEPSQPIYLYNAQGIVTLTVSPYDGNMDYSRGVYIVPEGEQNTIIETLSSATYWTFYSTSNILIDYDTVRFKIKKSMIPEREKAKITATFEYWHTMTPIHDVASIIDGRWDTQVQTEFFAEPPTGYNYAIIDLGATKNIQALDIVAGFYKPDELRKFDIDMRLSVMYSTNNIEYYYISDKTHNFSLAGGEAKSFEEDDLGAGFSARYLKLVLEKVGKSDYGEKDVYPVAFTEISAYDDVILKSEIKLIRTTALTVDVDSGDTTVNVTSTAGFTEPGSGETDTAYIEETAFTYTGLTATSFTGCVLDSGYEAYIGDRVSQTVDDSTNIYDDDLLLASLGDRVYKDVRISNEYLYSSTRLNAVAKSFLEEFYKDHSKIKVNVLYQPHLEVGQTVSVTDSYNSISAVKYFIESITDNMGFMSLVLGKYPA